MTKVLNRILLIDDDRATNYLHNQFFKTSGFVDQLDTVLNGQKGIEYLSTKLNGHYPCPEIIFLDINMPVMNGWEFIEEFNKLGKDKRENTKIVMLSTSQNLTDIERARSYGIVNFIVKPITIENLLILIE